MSKQEPKSPPIYTCSITYSGLNKSRFEAFKLEHLEDTKELVTDGKGNYYLVTEKGDRRGIPKHFREEVHSLAKKLADSGKNTKGRDQATVMIIRSDSDLR